MIRTLTLLTATAVQLAENGTTVETKAMTYHAFVHPSCYPDGTCDGIDFNNDGSLFDPCDIDSFLLVFSEGPCTPCGQ